MAKVTLVTDIIWCVTPDARRAAERQRRRLRSRRVACLLDHRVDLAVSRVRDEGFLFNHETAVVRADARAGQREAVTLPAMVKPSGVRNPMIHHAYLR